jgi:hypothetical protein
MVTGLEVMVDRVLDDGRSVVTNNSKDEVPIGTVFLSLQARRGHREGDRFWEEPLGPADTIELEVTEIEAWRQQIGALPRGHSAAFRLVGVGVDLLQSQLLRREKTVHVFLCSIRPAV